MASYTVDLTSDEDEGLFYLAEQTSTTVQALVEEHIKRLAQGGKRTSQEMDEKEVIEAYRDLPKPRKAHYKNEMKREKA